MGSSYTELVAWQRAMDLAVEVYRATQGFPPDERFGLTSQVRRAAVSVPSNIAEGQGRLTKGEFRQFLGQARGSLLEVETQMELARRLGFLPPMTADAMASQLSAVLRPLNGLLTSLAPTPETRNLKPET